MKREIKLLRRFSEDVRRSVVKEYESGKVSVFQLSRNYQVSTPTIYKWIHKYSNFEKQSIHIVEMKTSHSAKIKILEKRIKELEQIVGQKQIALDFKDKMIELAEEQYQISIKKNSFTPQSTGSEKTKKQ